MALHIGEIQALVEDLADLRGGQIQNVSNLDHELHWMLQIRIPGETIYVRCLLDRNFGRVSRAYSPRKQKNAHPSSFTMLLRKWMIGARVGEIRLLNEDRVVALNLYRGEESTSLILELTGLRQNAILVFENRVLNTVMADERIQIGQPYQPPPSTDMLMAQDSVALAQEIEERANLAYLEQRTETVRNALDQRLRAGIKRLGRRIKNIDTDLSRADDADELRYRADLLQTAYGRVRKGQTSVSVVDYANDMVERDIEIPSDIDLKDHIARLYHDYKRLKLAKQMIEERLLQSMDELSQLEKLRQRVALALPSELQDIESELGDKRTLPSKQKRTPSDYIRVPFREFRTSKGSVVLVGRSAKDNDSMRARHSRGNDIWLHARDWAGSHVILKSAPPDGEDLLEAALLAAFFSKGKNDSLVDVTWTHVKHIRRVKGGAPGLVTVAGGSTLTVAPAGSKLDELLRSEITQA